MAAFLNPITCLHLSKDDKSMAQTLIKKQKSLINSVKHQNTPARNKNNSSSNVLDKFAEMCYSLNEPDTNEINLDHELNIYLSTCDQVNDFSKYWQIFSKKLPILTAFVKRLSIASASSVPSESAFSIANYIQRKERSALSSKQLRYSMILRQSLSDAMLNFLLETN